MKLDLSMSIPDGYYRQIVGRSGMANICGVIVHDGATELDYRSVVCVVLFSLSDGEYMVETGNGIAQLIIERCFTPKFVEVTKFMDKTTERG